MLNRLETNVRVREGGRLFNHQEREMKTGSLPSSNRCDMRVGGVAGIVVYREVVMDNSKLKEDDCEENFCNLEVLC